MEDKELAKALMDFLWKITFVPNPECHELFNCYRDGVNLFDFIEEQKFKEWLKAEFACREKQGSGSTLGEHDGISN